MDWAVICHLVSIAQFHNTHNSVFAIVARWHMTLSERKTFSVKYPGSVRIIARDSHIVLSEYAIASCRLIDEVAVAGSLFEKSCPHCLARV